MKAHDHDITLDRLADYLDGRLDAASAAAVEKRLAESESLRADLEWLRGAARGFAALGERVVRDAPPVDLVAGVMDEVHRAAAPRPVRLPARRRVWAPLSYAAAAALLLACGVAYVWWAARPAPEDRPVIASPGTPETPGVTPVVDPPDPDEGLAPKKRQLEDVRRQLEDADTRSLRTARGATPVFQATARPELASLTVDAVVEARRDAAIDPERWAEFVQLAVLNPEEARRVAGAPNTPPDVVAGAVNALDQAEAQQLLLTVVGRMPDRTDTRLALARTYAAPRDADTTATADALEAFLEQIAALRESDPDNALFDYLEARERLARGDIEGALAALELARQKESANAYGREGANARAQALIAAGMAPDTARALSALTAGASEYDFLCDLADDLLQYGREYAEEGDTQSARRIYEAVQQLGQQITQGATLSQELLAGTDIGLAAVSVLEGFYSTLDSAEGIVALTASALELVGLLDGLSTWVDSMNAFLFGAGDTAPSGDNGTLNRLFERMLQEGDLALFDFTLNAAVNPG